MPFVGGLSQIPCESFACLTSSSSESLGTRDTFIPPIDQGQESARSLSSLPSDWWETSHPESSFSEDLSIASTSAEPLLPEDNDFPTVQDFNFRFTPFDTAPLNSTPFEAITHLSSNASAIGAETITSSGSPELPVSPYSFSKLDFGLGEDVVAADTSSNSETRRPGSSKRRRKPAGPSSKHTEPLPCPSCSKTFPRRCELTKHLKTHSRDFKCDVAGCKSGGFYRMRDLHRHVSSCHGAGQAGSEYLCRYQDCEYATKGFARNDNRLRHMRHKHDYPNGLESVA